MLTPDAVKVARTYTLGNSGPGFKEKPVCPIVLPKCGHTAGCGRAEGLGDALGDIASFRVYSVGPTGNHMRR